MNESILDYIKAARQAGLSDQEIQKKLLDAGWQEAEINSNFAFLPPSGAQANLQSSEPSGALGQEASATFGQRDEAGTGEVAQAHKWFSKRTLIISAAAVVLILAALGAYVYYAKAAPQAVWKKFSGLSPMAVLSAAQGKHVDFALSYNDSDSKMQGTVGVTGDVDDNSANTSADADISLSATFRGDSRCLATTCGGTLSIKDIKFLYLNKAAYLDVQSIPYINAFAKNFGGWIKLDTSEIPADQIAKIKAAFAQQENDPQFSYNALENQGIFAHQYVGEEKIAGVNTYHFKLNVNKPALEKFLDNYIKKNPSAFQNSTALKDSEGSAASADAIKLMNALIDSVKIKQDDVWVGVSDSNLHKAVEDVSMPSISKIIKILAGEHASNSAKQYADALNQASQSGSYTDLNLQLTFSDLKGQLNLTAPANALDVIKQFNQMQDTGAAAGMPGISGTQ